jgi:hypothetical protein
MAQPVSARRSDPRAVALARGEQAAFGVMVAGMVLGGAAVLLRFNQVLSD